MTEVEKRPLVRAQSAYLRKIVEEDEAYLERHGLSDPASLENLLEAAIQRGELRRSQYPMPRSQAGSGLGISPMTDEQQQEHALRAVERYLPPPKVEVEELLETLPNAERRIEYLGRLRGRMDDYEENAHRVANAENLLDTKYLDLVRLVDEQSRINYAVVNEQRGGGTSSRTSEADRQNRIETPLPDEVDDGTRALYRAVSDYPQRGIQSGKRYSLWPGDVLVRAGVVKPIPTTTPPDRIDATLDSTVIEQHRTHRATQEHRSVLGTTNKATPLEHRFHTHRNTEGALSLLEAVEAQPQRRWKSQNDIVRAAANRRDLSKEDRSVATNAKRLLEALGSPVPSGKRPRAGARILAEALLDNADAIREAARHHGVD